MNKQAILGVIALIVIGLVIWFGYIRRPHFDPEIEARVKKSLEVVKDFKKDEHYQYQFSEDKKIAGTKFTIPSELALGTNLSSDTYISLEHIETPVCFAGLFLNDPKVKNRTINDAGVSYSIASTTGAAAGNRYEESVYAIPGSHPCMAIRYFIHYSVLENYPAGSVKEFDKQALYDKFDTIRRTLIHP